MDEKCGPHSKNKLWPFPRCYSLFFPLRGSVPFLRGYGFKVIFRLRERNLASFNGGGPGLCLLATRYFTTLPFKGARFPARSHPKIGERPVFRFRNGLFLEQTLLLNDFFPWVRLAARNVHYFQMTENYDCC